MSDLSATDRCVKCGLCLPHCPTFRLSGIEAASPRGRISLMQAMDSPDVSWSPGLFRYLDRCLECRACEAMATEVDDAEFARECKTLAETGATTILELYNGEYFFHELDPQHIDLATEGSADLPARLHLLDGNSICTHQRGGQPASTLVDDLLQNRCKAHRDPLRRFSSKSSRVAITPAR